MCVGVPDDLSRVCLCSGVGRGTIAMAVTGTRSATSIGARATTTDIAAGAKAGIAGRTRAAVIGRIGVELARVRVCHSRGISIAYLSEIEFV